MKNLTVEEIRVRVFKLKTALFQGKYNHRSIEWQNGANDMLSEVLNVLDEHSK